MTWRQEKKDCHSCLWKSSLVRGSKTEKEIWRVCRAQKSLCWKLRLWLWTGYRIPMVLGYKQGCLAILCPFLLFSISSEMCKKKKNKSPVALIVYWAKLHCGSRQNNQLKRRNSEKTLNDRALYLLEWEAMQMDWGWRTGRVEKIGELWSPSVNISARML